jgi:predicted MFS family arabinose efflux permease
MLAAGFVGWGFWPSQSSLIAGLVPGSPALALSLNLTALNIGVALAARIGGVIVDQSNAAWLAAAGIPFALAALAVARFAIPARKAAA